MKLIGFLKKHDDYSFSKVINNYVSEEIETSNREDIINHLKKGKLCLAWMEWLFDDDDDETSIGANGYYTDGVWVWPNYLIYYLEKHPNFKLDQEFIDYVVKNIDEEINLGEEDINKIESKLYELTNSEQNSSSNLLE